MSIIKIIALYTTLRSKENKNKEIIERSENNLLKSIFRSHVRKKIVKIITPKLDELILSMTNPPSIAKALSDVLATLKNKIIYNIKKSIRIEFEKAEINKNWIIKKNNPIKILAKLRMIRIFT